MHIWGKCTPDTFLGCRVWCYFSSLAQTGLISITAQSSTRRRWSTSSSAPCPAGEQSFSLCSWNHHPPEGWSCVRTTLLRDLGLVWAKMILTPRWNGSTIKRFPGHRDLCFVLCALCLDIVIRIIFIFNFEGQRLPSASSLMTSIRTRTTIRAPSQWRSCPSARYSCFPGFFFPFYVETSEAPQPLVYSACVNAKNLSYYIWFHSCRWEQTQLKLVTNVWSLDRCVHLLF